MTDRDRDEEAQFEALFAGLQSRREPSELQRRRWRRTLTGHLAGRRRRRWLAAGAALAASTVIAVVAVSSLDPGQAAPAVADVMTAFGGNVVRRDGELVRTLAGGDAIAAGERVESGLRSGLGLRYRGVDLRIDADTRVEFAADHVALLRGRIYVDAGTAPVQDAAAPVSIRTPLGTVRHVGTQYLVVAAADHVVAAVREGAIVVSHRGREVRLRADRAEAVQVSIDSDGRVERSTASPVGDDWSWALAVSPGMVLAGRSADHVLRWAARERGQHLTYASADVERTAAQVVLSGADSRFAPDQAVAAVRAVAPSLRIDDRDAILAVSLRSGAAPGPP